MVYSFWNILFIGTILNTIQVTYSLFELLIFFRSTLFLKDFLQT